MFGGHPEDAYRAALRGQFTLLTSPAILSELAGKLREKFEFPESDIAAYVKQIGRQAEVVKPSERLTVLADESDNRVLECAVAGRGHLIVTGDRGLLTLRQYEGIGIMRPVDFLRTLGPTKD